MAEEWRPVVGRESDYEVSSFGRVRSRDREYWQATARGTPHLHRRKGQLLKPGIASNGYWTVALGRANTRTVHSLVAEAFIGPCPAGCEVRHRDGNRTNPALSNLEYGSRTENIKDAVRHGTWMSDRRRAHCSQLWKYREGLI